MIIYENQEIVVITILKSTNKKTGNLAQTYILNKDTLKGGFCESCTSDKICYVFNGLKPVQDSYKAGKYPKVENIDLSWKRVRLGAYGDPALIPLKILESWNLKKHTGYTHMWRLPHVQEYKSVLMASCETEECVELARSLGWRVFYNRLDKWVTEKEGDSFSASLVNVIECPNSSKSIQCDACMLCDGKKSQNDPRKSIFIDPHGGRLSLKNAKRTIQRAHKQNEDLIKSWLLNPNKFEVTVNA